MNLRRVQRTFIGDGSADANRTIYLTMNNQLAGWVDMQDEIRPEAIEIMAFFKKRNIKTILLSGDRKQKCLDTAAALGMDEVICRTNPATETCNRLNNSPDRL